MTSKVARLTPAGRQRILRGLARSWQPGGAHDLRFHHAPVDADTLRKRALHDRKGSHYATISTNGFVFELFWSASGRVDQVDVFIGGKHMLTARPSICLEWCREKACFSRDQVAY